MLGVFFVVCVGNLVFIDGNMTAEMYQDILQKKLVGICEEIEHEQRLVGSTRQRPQAYSTHRSKLAGSRAYKTAQMAFFFVGHESYRTLMRLS